MDTEQKLKMAKQAYIAFIDAHWQECDKEAALDHIIETIEDIRKPKFCPVMFHIDFDKHTFKQIGECPYKVDR